MKNIKVSVVLVAMLISATSFAQGVEQALLFSQRNQIGSARTIAMGNAFTAVGGDLGAVPINPASAGVLKTSEFDISLGLYSAGSSASYLNNPSRDGFSKFGVPSVSFETVFPTNRRNGWKSFSLGLSVNRVASYNSSMSVSGRMSWDNVNTLSSWMASKTSEIMGISWETMDKVSYNNTTIPWAAILGFDTQMIQKWGHYGDGYYLAATENVINSSLGRKPFATVNAPLVQSFSRNVYGGNDEISLNIAGNYSDRLYLGASINLYTISYSSNESYQESSENPSQFDTKFDYFIRNYKQSTSGAGLDLKVGAIFLPTDNLRLGLTITTPTWHNMTDSWCESMRAKTSEKADVVKESPVGTYNYRLISPMRVGAGLAYTFGHIGLVSFDWEMTDYRSVRLQSMDRLSQSFTADNEYMNNQFKVSHLLRAGIELNVLPFVSLRGGYNYYTPVSNDNGYRKDSHYYSAGLGFRLGEQVFMDLAYQGQTAVAQQFSLYNDYDGVEAPVGVIKARQDKFLATFRFKL